jgi:hypothetical protein
MFRKIMKVVQWARRVTPQDVVTVQIQHANNCEKSRSKPREFGTASTRLMILSSLISLWLCTIDRVAFNPFERDELQTLVFLAGSNVAQLRLYASAVLSNVCSDAHVQVTLMEFPSFMTAIRGLISCTDSSERCKIHAFSMISLIAEKTEPIKMKNAFLNTVIEVIATTKKEQKMLLITGAQAVMWMLVNNGTAIPSMERGKLSVLLNLLKQENPWLVSFTSASLWALSKNDSNVETLVSLKAVGLMTDWIGSLLSFSSDVDDAIQNQCGKKQKLLASQMKAMGNSAMICMQELLLGALLALSHYASSYEAILESEGIELLIHVLTIHDFLYTHAKKLSLMALWKLLESPKIALSAIGLKLVEVLIDMSLDVNTNPPEIRLLSAKLLLYLQDSESIKNDSRSLAILTRNFESNQNIEAIMIGLVASDDCSEEQIFGMDFLALLLLPVQVR